jgi:hypothetical protein
MKTYRIEFFKDCTSPALVKRIYKDFHDLDKAYEYVGGYLQYFYTPFYEIMPVEDFGRK